MLITCLQSEIEYWQKLAAVLDKPKQQFTFIYTVLSETGCLYVGVYFCMGASVYFCMGACKHNVVALI